MLKRVFQLFKALQIFIFQLFTFFENEALNRDLIDEVIKMIDNKNEQTVVYLLLLVEIPAHWAAVRIF